MNGYVRMHGEGEWRNNAFCHGRVNSRNENMFPSPQTPPFYSYYYNYCYYYY